MTLLNIQHAFKRFKCNRDKANTFLERMRNGVSNHDILAEVLDKERVQLSEHIYELPKDQMTKASLSDATKYKLQLHASFNKPDPDAVYLVGRPNRWARGLSRNPKPCHWSIYTSKHVYHLKLAEGAQGPSIVLRDDGPQEWKLLGGPFIAYYIGVTDYHADDIPLIAKWVSTQLDHDTLSMAAYEQFVFGLAIRILRGPSNTTAFIGDFWQIMEHDIGLAPSGFFTGVNLADPDEDISNRLKK